MMQMHQERDISSKTASSNFWAATFRSQGVCVCMMWMCVWLLCSWISFLPPFIQQLVSHLNLKVSEQESNVVMCYICISQSDFAFYWFPFIITFQDVSGSWHDIPIRMHSGSFSFSLSRTRSQVIFFHKRFSLPQFAALNHLCMPLMMCCSWTCYLRTFKSSSTTANLCRVIWEEARRQPNNWITRRHRQGFSVSVKVCGIFFSFAPFCHTNQSNETCCVDTKKKELNQWSDIIERSILNPVYRLDG